MKQLLIGKDKNELETIVTSLGMPRYVGKQLCEWLYAKRATSFEQMTNISAKNRALLAEQYAIGRHAPTAHADSIDGTKKYLFEAYDIVKTNSREHLNQGDSSTQTNPTSSDYVECVYLPETDRTTLCVSTQAGCKMGCKFCMTGTLGFHGHLSAADILNQVLYFDDLTNIVLMGEGEPMDNLDEVLRALNVLTSDWGLGWSPKRITVSSVGLVPQLKRFIEECDCHLAISLHNPFPQERKAIMPIEQRYSITQVVDLLNQYDFSHQRRISFEYICWGGVNDTLAHAKEILRLLHNLPSARVNLIRYHSTNNAMSEHSEKPSENAPLFPSSDMARMEMFRDYLSSHGLTTTIRKSRGEDILAACGMLVNSLNKC